MLKEIINNRGEQYKYIELSFFSSVICIIMSLIFFVLRFGFGDNIYESFKILGLGLFLLNFGEVVKFNFNIKDKNLFISNQAFTIYSLMLIIILGVINIFNNIFIILISILGIISFIYILIFYFRIHILEKIVIILTSIFFSLWIAGIIWGAKHLNILFLEKILLGDFHIDQLFHCSISNMIKTYNISSTGLDGLPYLGYHIGSHWAFANISNLLNINVLTFYNKAYPIIMIPLFFKSFLNFSIILKEIIAPKRKIKFNFLFWLILYIGFVFFLPRDFLLKRNIAVRWDAIFRSESYLVSLILTFLFFSLIIYFWKDFKLNKNKLKSNNIIFLLIVSPISIAVIGICKISLMFLILAVALYLFFRLKLYRYIYFIISIILTFSISFFIYKNFSPQLDAGKSFFLFYFFKKFIKYPILYIIFHYFTSWFYIATKFYLKIRNDNIKVISKDFIKRLFKYFKNKEFIDIEVIMVLVIIGSLPNLFLLSPGGATFYFSEFQFWFSLSLILSYILILYNNPVQKMIEEKNNLNKLKLFLNYNINIKVKYLLIFIFLIPFMINFINNLINPFKELIIKDNFQIRNQINKEINDYNYSLDHVKDAIKSRNLKKIKEALIYVYSCKKEKMPNIKSYNVISKLIELSKLPLDEKKITFLFIPKDNIEYWNLFKFTNNNKDKIPFLAPAITGIAMIKGLPEPEERKTIYYGYNIYDFNDYNEDLLGDLNYVKTEVKKKEFKKLIVLDKYQNIEKYNIE